MNRERLEQIGKFLEGRMVVHRNVEHDSPWTTEEKMIQELYDNYLDLLIEYGKQKEVIDKLEKENEQLKGNWNKIKEYFNERIEVCDNRLSSPFCNLEKATKERLIFSQCLEKLEELEESDDNVKD